MAKLRAGLVGAGMMGRHHARILKDLAGVDLVAVVDPAGDQYGVAGDCPVLPDVASLIRFGVDLAIVAVPTRFHEEEALKLAAARVNTLVEKPISHCVEAGIRMAEAFDAAGIVGAVGHIERYNASLQEMRRRIEEGQLGEIFQITTRRQGPFPGRIVDVGVGRDLASHDIDSTSWVAQSPYALVGARVAHRTGNTHEDMLLITGTLDNGVIVNHIVNWLSPMKERVTIISGERGMFVADTLTADLIYYANGTVPTQWDTVSAFRGVSEGDVIRYAFPKREPLRVELEAFRDAVLGQSATVVTMAESVRTLRVVEAALDSATSGRFVSC
ncbi:MAG: Gfo/Idh/MocA family oxidoreductase [Propionibacteriaceae bacterium]|nr:Gfo/Idh/MocA family oxidoreductase [Propionibacteriaceae bacterium]